MTTSTSGGPARRLEQLLEFVLDGSCTDADRCEFSRLLDANPQAIANLARDVFVHNLLMWHGDEEKAELALAAQLGPESCCDIDDARPDLCCVESPRRPRHWPTFKRAFRMNWGHALAATLLLAGGLLTLHVVQDDSSHGARSVGRIIRSENVVWSDASTAQSRGADVVPGRLETKSGQLVLLLSSGPTVRLDGPASLMIESEMLLHLDQGQATARVPKSLTGFTIKTPTVNVVDRGTEFGVAIRDDGHTDVVVFDGEVELRDRFSAHASPRRLAQGEGARVDRQGHLKRIMQIAMGAGGSWWTKDYPADARSVIREVRDNIPPDDGRKYFCYQIAHHGFQEDVFAYGDHPHQFNGLTDQGLPAMLLGADYVKTFNDYRYLNDFRMEVILERPANLYVLFDDRVPPPEWLTDQFVDAGVDIGLDEGPWPAGDQAWRPDLPPFENAVGGGVSIDNRFSVWHRLCLDTTPIRLGPVGPTSEARAMYGVAATPLDADDVAWRRRQNLQPEGFAAAFADDDHALVAAAPPAGGW